MVLEDEGSTVASKRDAWAHCKRMSILISEQDDALSKADSLSVNLGQDIAALGDLEEKGQGNAINSKIKFGVVLWLGST